MHIPIVLAFVVLQSTLCLNIRVPVDWNDDSEVNKNEKLEKNEEAGAKHNPIIPDEYFQYPAKKPQFAIDIAANHGVQSPEKLFKSHPIVPYTGLPKPKLGEHSIQDPKNIPYIGYAQNSDGLIYVKPATTSFEIHHQPYKAEEPALQQLYKDTIFQNMRNKLRDNNKKIQEYQKEAEKSDVTKEEYLENPEQIDRKKVPQQNIPAQFEEHRPQRRPIYYSYPPTQNYRTNILNQKLTHPWNQNIAKVTPLHYRPIKKHLHGLRQQHASKFDDERNEYPQLPPKEENEGKPDGYDIYEKGKDRFEQFKNQVDDTINKVVHEKRPYDSQNPELVSEHRNDDDSSDDEADEEEFVPVKNYAQVRKTETTKHLPREAALEDAENFEEIQNAPRLREAIKSKKAQIVYSEEGYEDSAYDHAGEQKHATDHEHHGGYLKKNEISSGKFKKPSISTNYGVSKGSEHKDQVLHGEKWNNDVKENEDESETDYYESLEGDSDTSYITDQNIKNEKDQNYRKNDNKLSENSHEQSEEQTSLRHDVIKRETVHKTPQTNSTIVLSDAALDTKAKPNAVVDNNIKIKYPYYYQNLQLLSKNSPLRYAENFDLIPKKTNGGTEFYDSRAELLCPEVEDDVDPLPDKFKKNGHPDNNENNESVSDNKSKEESKFDILKNKQRLKGLGDKIDCFKAKYFGENPLDSPFFEEDIIENPEPLTKPTLEIFNTKPLENQVEDQLLTHNTDLFSVLEKLRNNNNKESLINTSSSHNTTIDPHLLETYLDAVDLNNNETQKTKEFSLHVLSSLPQNANNKSQTRVRQKRATPFTYEPYKIIRDSQIQDSKKTTTTGNISPLIKQLQSSRVIDKVTTNQDKDQAIKKNNTRVYKDIGKGDRQENHKDEKNYSVNPSFVDVSTDQRRGEPKYEIRSANHKAQFSPVENKRSMSVVDYKTKTTKESKGKNSTHVETTTQPQLKRSKRRKPTTRPYFDVSKYLPQVIETQNIAASNTVRKIIRATTPESISVEVQRQNRGSNGDKKYDYGEDDKIITTSTTITPTTKKRRRGTTTTFKPIVVEDEIESPKLNINRFYEYEPNEKTSTRFISTEKPTEETFENERSSPKYTEKKKKSSKSTLVTDTKSYGEEADLDDETRKKEVDDLIGVKHDMEEYIPLYERVVNKINRMKNENEKKRRDHDFDSEISTYNDNIKKRKYHIDDVDVDDDDDDEDEDEDDEGSHFSFDNDDDEDEDEEEENDEDDTVQVEDDKKKRLEATTSEPTKRTLAKTTEAPATTTESRSAKLELKPIVLKKKIEIHNELPVNNSSPDVTQFKQDIKEIEIIKQMPPKLRKKNKNIEALDLYRDEKLAEEINKLGDVEIFRENLDLKSGPKHGGNYRSITQEELQKENLSVSRPHDQDDVETSQTETRRLIDLTEVVPSKRRDSYTRRSSPQMNNEKQNAKFVELSDTYDNKPRQMHGGNLKLPQTRDQKRNSKSEKYVDIDEEEEDEPSNMHGGNFQSYGNNRNSDRQMHGGNYRSAKLVKSHDNEEQTQGKTKNDKSSATGSSNDYEQDVLTTTPGYILDPSKRKYYYVDA